MQTDGSAGTTTHVLSKPQIQILFAALYLTVDIVVLLRKLLRLDLQSISNFSAAPQNLEKRNGKELQEISSVQSLVATILTREKQNITKLWR